MLGSHLLIPNPIPIPSPLYPLLLQVVLAQQAEQVEEQLRQNADVMLQLELERETLRSAQSVRDSSRQASFGGGAGPSLSSGGGGAGDAATAAASKQKLAAEEAAEMKRLAEVREKSGREGEREDGRVGGAWEMGG